ncbi:Stk1 family PASTA domain-containing Ser/Thr kinase [Hominiventricola filiformis]|uniref:non-specific serine/threonine protein kinase n=1 Tax=Hominiventricola filiformis TaxID=2885352 RepID=A0AAE3A1U2_9FIRM|nr:Stk1 family PASTA domain-containing Ser/Thr kinase [Hominiventricola filiformis]MCC2124576.1 Stk1 family PASTA domain-containing Ser/Thr kinase [Hominiventricola filiformis]
MIKVGTIVGDRYEILEKIGVGGMAEVFKGKDHKLNRYVAVKVLKEEFRENDAFVKKFKEEAQAAARLAHPNIVNVYDVGDENGIYYIVMELVEGITLKNYIERKGSLTIKEATSIAIQVCAGLEVAHNNHIVHRDIKPQNIIISREGKVKVTDFGIAKATTSQTTTANAMGSVHYASPEQARGGYVDHRSDIYSLGIVLYEMVTGRVPFDGETAVTVAVKHLQEEMVPPSVYCKNIPYSLEQIIKKCTEKSPDRRYQDIGDLLADLKQSLMDPDGDFVQMIDVDEQARTVVMNKGTSSKIRNSRKVEVPVSRDEDEDEEDDEYEDDEDDEDEDDDEELSPAVEKAMTVAGVVLAVIIVLIVLLLVSKALGLGKEKNDTSSSDSQQTEQTADEDTESEDGNSSSANTVVMPNLLGKTMTEAKIELKDLGIDITLKGSESSSKYSAGQIMEQNIAEGTKVEVGSSVEVTIAGSGSSGTSGSSTSSTAADSTSSTTDTEVTVPNVVGKDEATARAAIEAAGLTVGTVTEASSDTVTSGLVISQTVAANTKTAKGTKVNLVLSSGPSSVKVTDVIGHEQSRAEQELAAAGFQVSVKEAYSSDVRSGLVISTTPDRGTPAKPGSTVTMTVSQGKEKVTIPSVSVGMTYEAAAEKLEDAGFTGTISEATESSNSVGSGFVTRYSPSGAVDPDGTVTIYVSTGSASGTGTDGTEGMPAN